MTEPLAFPALTPRHQLPLLFAGQSQKEVSVNAAHALIDMLLHCAVLGEAAAPPPEPAEERDCWLVGAAPQGAFAGRAGSIACFAGGAWVFAAPRDGMRAFDQSTGQLLLFRDAWRREPIPDLPSGGATVDVEARLAIGAIVALLQRSAILPSN